MCIEELKSTCVRTSTSSGWEIVNFDGELFQLCDAAVEFGDKCTKCSWIQIRSTAVTEKRLNRD